VSWLKDMLWKERGAFVVPCSLALTGRSVVIVGGGPGLSPGHVKALQAAQRAVLVNNSYMVWETPCPVVAMDRRWWRWHGQQVVNMGHMAVTALRPGQSIDPTIQHFPLEKKPELILTDKPEYLTGRNSGHAAIQFAVHLGSPRIYLAGFDMDFAPNGKTHWHEGHAIPSSQANYRVRFRPALEDLVKQAALRNIQIRAITPTTADIPTAPFDEALKDLTCLTPA